jgi:tetratricopeptide (TPR) repeat protein
MPAPGPQFRTKPFPAAACVRCRAVLLMALGLAILGAGAAAARLAPAAAQAPAAASDRSAAAKDALTKADEALRRDDLQAALQAANQALDLDPANAQAHLRRVTILWRLRGTGKTTNDNQRLEDAVRGDLRAVIAAVPDSTAAGVARDWLAAFDRGEAYAAPPVACSAEGSAEFAAAEQLFASRRFEESLVHYERAAASCPDNPVIWTSYGDAYFSLGDMPKAQHYFEMAVTWGPWLAQAHRYLADALAKQDRFEAAYHECVLAVLSDPTYEAAWGYLRSVVIARHGTWGRVAAVKPSVKKDPAKQNVDIVVDPQATGTSWLAYALAKAAPAAATPPGAAPPPTALARERDAVRTVLAIRREKSDGEPFWNMIDRADRAGFLDEAIFLHLAEPDLLEEYHAYRDAHRERLVKYVETVLAPLPARP